MRKRTGRRSARSIHVLCIVADLWIMAAALLIG
jgi:hypothetical protein